MNDKIKFEEQFKPKGIPDKFYCHTDYWNAYPSDMYDDTVQSSSICNHGEGGDCSVALNVACFCLRRVHYPCSVQR